MSLRMPRLRVSWCIDREDRNPRPQWPRCAKRLAMSEHKKALVLFSGGQDSTTCLAWALDRYEHVETIGFDYGQRHRVELECRSRFRAALSAFFPGWSSRLKDDH